MSKLNKNLAQLTLCLSLPLLLVVVAAVGQKTKHSGHVEKEQSWTGNYNNYEYGYALRIPRGLVGVSPPAPLPQHGIKISLTQNHDAYITADASLSAVDYPSLDAAVDYDVEEDRKTKSDFEVLSRTRERLGTLGAIRVVARYKSAGSTSPLISETITAIRKAKRPEEGVLYTTSLVTPEQRYPNDGKVFSSIVRSWRLRALPK